MRRPKKLCRLPLIDMLGDFTRGRYRALELIADHVREPSRELRLNAIVCEVSDEDLRWVTDKVHYFLLRLLEDAEYDPIEDFEEIPIGLTSD
jgi:hypothetical protein